MSSDFIYVKSKKKKSRKKNRPIPEVEYADTDGDIPIEKIICKISLACEDLSNSEYYKSLLTVLLKALDEQNFDYFKDIVCYGLGRISDCVSSRYQFSLILDLKRHFKSEVFVYDPVFNKVDLEVLKEFDCNVISENENGKRVVTEPTLLFLPHCPHYLLNNFLWRNWGTDLKYCTVFSNSISETVELIPTKTLHKYLKYISGISTLINELKVENNFRYSDIFNNLSVHILPKDKLEDIAVELFDSEEPVYDSDLSEIF